MKNCLQLEFDFDDIKNILKKETFPNYYTLLQIAYYNTM